MAAALLAQGLTPAGALALAVHLHGAAADALARARGGPLGITASALAPAAARQLNRWTRGRQRQA
jgi:NAD(P)H-hydrate repair Nnr-like enzyme with NAD(P)H-hydrate dehydratase domain